MSKDIKDRVRGVAVGAAIGDALGMPLEFCNASPNGCFITGMQDGRLERGSFTDDTEMALALADSLLAHKSLNEPDLTERFLAWYKAEPPDVGIHTSNVLEQIMTGESWETAASSVQSRYPESAGNGSIMRCWPVAIAASHDLALLEDLSRRQSRVTHAHEECTAGCAYVNRVIVHLLHGVDPYSAYEKALAETPMPEGLHNVIKLAPNRRREELRNTGWVRHTIESAVWGLLSTTSFEECLIQVINLGADADTAGTVAGAFAGAYYGLSSIPQDWISVLHGPWPVRSDNVLYKDNLVRIADELTDSLT